VKAATELEDAGADETIIFQEI